MIDGYRAQLQNPDGTPAAGSDIGTVQPGSTGTTTVKLVNTGDEGKDWYGVLFLLSQNVPGLTVTVDGTPLTPGVALTTDPVPVGGSVTVTYARAVAPDADPGPFRIPFTARPLK